MHPGYIYREDKLTPTQKTEPYWSERNAPPAASDARRRPGQPTFTDTEHAQKVAAAEAAADASESESGSESD